ncbi:hypothetical protein D3C75_1112670 [compost metagenome]
MLGLALDINHLQAAPGQIVLILDKTPVVVRNLLQLIPFIIGVGRCVVIRFYHLEQVAVIVIAERGFLLQRIDRRGDTAQRIILIGGYGSQRVGLVQQIA